MGGAGAPAAVAGALNMLTAKPDTQNYFCASAKAWRAAVLYNHIIRSVSDDEMSSITAMENTKKLLFALFFRNIQ